MHYREEEITLLVTRADLAEQDEHLKGCPICRARFDFLQQVHGAFVRESANPPDPRIVAAVGADTTPHEIHLRLFSPAAELTGFGEDNQIVLLAAQDNYRGEETRVAVAVFASETDGTILRVVEEGDGIYQLFLLADDEQKRNLVLLGIVTPAGDRALLATDEHGTASCRTREKIAWAEASVVLYLPLAAFDLNGRCSDGTRLTANDVRLEVEVKEEFTHLHVESAGASVPRRVLLVYADSGAETVELTAGSVQVPGNRADTLIAIRVFS